MVVLREGATGGQRPQEGAGGIDPRFTSHIERYRDHWEMAIRSAATTLGLHTEESLGEFTELAYALENITLARASLTAQDHPYKRVILIGPQNVGKTTLRFRLVEAGIPDIPNYVTRPPRRGEVHGVHAHFVSEEELRAMHERGEVLSVNQQRHSEHEGTYFSGAPKAPFVQSLTTGKPFVSERQLQSWEAMEASLAALPEILPEHLEGTLVVFLVPPSLHELGRRAIERVFNSYEPGGKDGIEEFEARVLTEFERSFGKHGLLTESLRRHDIVYLVSDDTDRLVGKIKNLLAPPPIPSQPQQPSRRWWRRH